MLISVPNIDKVTQATPDQVIFTELNDALEIDSTFTSSFLCRESILEPNANMSTAC